MIASALWLAHLVAAAGNFSLDPKMLDEAETTYGKEAKKRLLSWELLIRENTNRSEREQLETVNAFFNRIRFVDDRTHWRHEDYWATPVEFLVTNGGDCEDFSLAKYFTLKILGIPESKMNLTYVKAWRLNQAHMVLTYYSSPGAVPLVLDNLIDDIRPASRRTDLYPVYSFNGSGLWLAKGRERGKLLGQSDRLSLWSDLLKRMPADLQ